MRGAQSALKPVGLSADAGARAGQVQVQGAGGSAYDDGSGLRTTSSSRGRGMAAPLLARGAEGEAS